MAIATTTCSYSHPVLVAQFVSPNPDQFLVGVLYSTTSEVDFNGTNPNIPNHTFQWASSTCVTDSASASGGGSVSVDLDPLTVAISYGLGTIIFLMVLVLTFVFIKRK